MWRVEIESDTSKKSVKNWEQGLNVGSDSTVLDDAKFVYIVDLKFVVLNQLQDSYLRLFFTYKLFVSWLANNLNHRITFSSVKYLNIPPHS